MQLTDLLGGGLKVLNVSGGCDTCPRARKDFVPPKLTDSGILILGEAPGATEVEEQEGYTGKSGRYLRSVLKKNGITEYSLCNSINCRPPDNRNPHKKELSACFNQFVVNIIKQHHTVLLTGKVAADTVFPHSTYAKLRGHVAYHVDFPGTRFFTAYHPAYPLRRQDKVGEFEEQIARFARKLGEDSGNPSWNVHRGDSQGTLDKLREILQGKRYSFDIETNGLESWHPDQKITSFALCATTDEAVFFHENDPYWDEALRAVLRSMEDSDTFVIAHNAGFDLEWLERQFDVDIRCQIADTQYLYYLINMGFDYRKARMRSLKDLTDEELDGYSYLVPAPHLCEDPNLLANYNTEDIIRTLELFQNGFLKLNSKQKDLLLRVGSPSSLAVRRLSTNGLYLDSKYSQKLADEVQSSIQGEIEAWVEEDPVFDPDTHISGDGFIKYVFGLHDLPVVKRTEKEQNPSVDEEAIKELIEEHGADFLKHRLEIQSLEKEFNTFIKPYSTGKAVDPYTGRIHPSYFNCFTRTGRLSSRDPNAQNWKRGPKIRNQISAAPGKVFVQSDLSQIELRLAMCLAEDPTGIEAYLNEGDLHARTAATLAKRAGRDEWTKEDRTNAKILNFAIVYGGNAGTVKRYAKQTFGIDYSWKEAEKFHEMFFSLYSGLIPWHQSLIDDLRANRGYTETVLGFPRYLHGWDDPDQGRREHFERVAINTSCQSTAGLITIYILYLVQQKIRENGMYKDGVITVGSVHDSIMFESPEDLVRPLINEIEEAVSEVYQWVKSWMVVPLVMDYEVGSSWGNLKEIEAH